MKKDPKDIHVENMEMKEKLISTLLSAVPANEGLVAYKDVLYGSFLKFANEENAISNEAEMMLKLQEIEKELELVSSSPALHTKHMLAVGGGFSAGKSEFISSLIEGSLKLPIGVVPTTAIPTYVMHGKANSFAGCTQKGAAVDLLSIDKDFQSKLSHDFIKSFGFNIKQIMPFMILGTKIPYEDICFVDTPGYNPASTSDGFTSEDINTATDFLGNANSLLWLIGADANGTIPASDLEFLSELDLSTKKLYVVLNKADLRPMDGLEDVLDEISESLDDYDIEVEGISAYSSVMQKEYASIDMPLSDFLEASNTQVQKHDEIVSAIFDVHNAYKKALEDKVEEKQHIKKQLHSMSLDMLEDGVDVSSSANARVDSLKPYFSTKMETKLLKSLDEIFIDFKKSVEAVFGRESSEEFKVVEKDESSSDVHDYANTTATANLMWEDVADPEESEMTWDDAMEYAKNLRLGGYDDWRLPTIEELNAVVSECGGINTVYGDDDWDAITDKNIANETYQANYAAKGFASNHYWSSTTNAGTSYFAWGVYFDDGYQGYYYKYNSYYVRCVRAGQ